MAADKNKASTVASSGAVQPLGWKTIAIMGMGLLGSIASGAAPGFVIAIAWIIGVSLGIRRWGVSPRGASRLALGATIIMWVALMLTATGATDILQRLVVATTAAMSLGAMMPEQERSRRWMVPWASLNAVLWLMHGGAAEIMALPMIGLTVVAIGNDRWQWKTIRGPAVVSATMGVLAAVLLPLLRLGPTRPQTLDLETILNPGASLSLRANATPVARFLLTLHSSGAPPSWKQQTRWLMRTNNSMEPGVGIYWRAAVLSEFTGRLWRSGPVFRAPPPRPVRGPPPAPSKPAPVWMETAWQALVATDTPVALEVPGAQLPTPPGPVARGQVVTSGVPWPPRRRVGDVVGWGFGFLLPAERAEDLALPPGVAPRARAMAMRWRAEGMDDRAVVTAMMHRFATDGYRYTLTPPRPSGDPIDGLLFGTRLGYCQQYASAAAVLLRAAGIPARVAIGYATDVLTPAAPIRAGVWKGMLRARDAHAWVEAYSPEWGGWGRIDPTAVVPPAPPELSLLARWWNGLPAWSRRPLFSLWSSWRSMPLFNAGGQAMRKGTAWIDKGWRTTAWRKWGRLILAVGLTLGLLGLGWGGYRYWDRPSRRWRAVIRRAVTRGKGAHPQAKTENGRESTPLEQARAAARCWPAPEQESLMSLADAYAAWRFADQPLPEDWRRRTRRWPRT